MNKKQLIDKYLDEIDLGVFKKVLKSNLGMENENLLIIGDEGYRGRIISPVLSNAFRLAAEDIGIESSMVLEKVKLKGEHADKMISQGLLNLPKKSVIIMNMSHKIGKLESIGLSFRKFCRKKGHRFTSASSLGVIENNKIHDIINAYDVDYEELSKKAHKVKKAMDNASELNVTTKAGTDVTFNITDMKASVSDGIYKEPGAGGNLPGTETYIAPKKNKVEGKIVIDGSMRTRKGTSIVKEPIEMTIKKGVIVAMNDGEDSRALEETLRWAHEKAKYPWGVRRIGEFGLGLNPKAKVIGCTVVDEKTYGTGHFAIGSNHWFGGSIYAIIHLDQVFHKPKLKLDGKAFRI